MYRGYVTGHEHRECSNAFKERRRESCGQDARHAESEASTWLDILRACSCRRAACSHGQRLAVP